MNKAARDAMRIQAIALAQVIGQRAAGRQLDVPEKTVHTWCRRLRLKLGSDLVQFQPGVKPMQSQATATDALKALEGALKVRSEATKLQLAIAADNASSKMAGMAPEALVQRDTAQAADSWSRAADRTHGWSAERAKAPVVQIANIHVPTAADMQRDKDTDAKLDRITALLASSTLPSSKEGS